MTDTSTARAIGTALIVSEDTVATRQIAEAMQELALSVEVCIKVSDAMDRVNYSKLEVAVIDFSLENQAALLLEQLRGSASIEPNCGRIRNHEQQCRDRICPESGFKFCARQTSDFRIAPAYSPSRVRNDCARAPSLLPLSHFRSGSRQQERGIRNLRRNGECQRTRRSIQRVQRRLDPARR